MKVVLKKVGEDPEVIEIDDFHAYERIRELVGGRIETVGVLGRMRLCLDEEGKLKGKKMNIVFYADNRIVDVGVGDVVAVAIKIDDFDGLSQDEIDYIIPWLKQRAIKGDKKNGKH